MRKWDLEHHIYKLSVCGESIEQLAERFGKNKIEIANIISAFDRKRPPTDPVRLVTEDELINTGKSETFLSLFKPEKCKVVGDFKGK